MLSPGWLMLYVIAAGIAVQGLLALRVWFQLAGDTGRGGLAGSAYELSSILVGPFKSFEPTTPIKDSGILEFSSLVAIEAYLIATLVTLTVLLSARIALVAERTIVRHYRRSSKTERLVLTEPPV